MNRRSFLKSILATSIAIATGATLSTDVFRASANTVNLSKFVIDKDAIRIYDEKGTLRIAIGKLS